MTYISQFSIAHRHIITFGLLIGHRVCLTKIPFHVLQPRARNRFVNGRSFILCDCEPVLSTED
jgi:hypothetical protein